MKFRIVLVLIMVTVCLIACGKPAQTEITPTQIKPPEAVATEPVTEQTEPVPVEDYILETPYYTLTLPGNWETDCCFELNMNNDGTYMLCVYEAQSYAERTGNLFTIRLCEPAQDPADFLSYKVLGTIESPDWVYNVVAVFSDALPDNDTYHQMSSLVPQILDSFTPTNACIFNPGQVAEVSNVIETLYYTLTLPEDWIRSCVWEVILGEDFTYTLVLSEAGSYEVFGGGRLCSIMLYPTDDPSYKELPDYELLCALDTPEGSFYVVALFPTDVQFNGETAKAYNAMFAQLQDVLYSLQPGKNIEMAMP